MQKVGPVEPRWTEVCSSAEAIRRGPHRVLAWYSADHHESDGGFFVASNLVGRLHLQHVVLSCDPLIEHRVNEKA